MDRSIPRIADTVHCLLIALMSPWHLQSADQWFCFCWCNGWATPNIIHLQYVMYIWLRYVESIWRWQYPKIIVSFSIFIHCVGADGLQFNRDSISQCGSENRQQVSDSWEHPAFKDLTSPADDSANYSSSQWRTLASSLTQGKLRPVFRTRPCNPVKKV